MGIFRRAKPDQPITDEDGAVEDAPASEEEAPTADEHTAPSDISEVDSLEGYHDLGSLLIPAIKGIQLGARTAADKKTIVRAVVRVGSSAMEIMAVAAPKSGGAWAQMRERTREEMEKRDATVTEVESRYGTELRVDTLVELPNGSRARMPIRVIGVEGPRWLLRIEVVGPGAVDAEATGEVEAVIDRLVVRRDSSPRPPLDPLPLHLPARPTESADDA